MKGLIIIFFTSLLCFTSKAQTFDFNHLDSTTSKQDLQRPLTMAHAFCCDTAKAYPSDGYVIANYLTHKVSENFDGTHFLVWNSRKVPKTGFYSDTSFNRNKYEKNTSVTYAVFYDAHMIFKVDFKTDTSHYYNLELVDTSYISTLIAK